MFYWTGEELAPETFDPRDRRWVEIWNDVFMQYNKKEDGTFEKLEKPNVDTGMGLERTLAVLNGKKSVFEIELFTPIFQTSTSTQGHRPLLVAEESSWIMFEPP